MPARKITLLALVLAMLLGTLLVTWAAVRDERARADSRGQQAASDGAGFLTLDLASATTSLNDAAGFVVGSTSVTPADFDAYGRQVLGFSSLSAMAWVERVTDAQRDRFEARLRTITEPTGQGGVRVAARRSVYFPVTLRAVEKATIGTLGGDLGIDLPHRATIERALATGAMALSEPLVLRPDGTIGVVMYQPVYAGGVTPTTPGGRSRKLLGIASASFALSELLPDVEAAARPGLRVQVVYEGQVLPLGERPLRGGHRAVVASGGRTFVVVAQTPSISMLLPIVTLAGGIALTSMVCLLFLVLIRRDRRQQRAIVAATRDLRASRESHRALTENSPDVVMRCDLGGRCLYANPAIEQITGMPAEHYVGRTLSEVGLPEAAAAALHGALEQVRATHQVADLDFDLGVSGQTRSFHSLIAPEIGLDGEIASILVVARDVSEQRRAQSELRRSRDYSAALVSSLHDGLCVLDADGRLVDVNPRMCEMTGFDRSELVGTAPPFRFHPPETRATTKEVVGAFLRDGTGGEFEMTYRRKDETRFSVILSVSSLRDQSGAVLGGVALVRDVEAQLAAERVIRANEARYRSLVESMATGVVVQTVGGTIVEANSAAEQILGLSRDQIMGRDSLDSRWRAVREDGSPFPGAEHPAMLTLQTGQPLRGVIMGVHTPDGALTWISIATEPLDVDGAPSVVCSFIDVTVRIEAEKEQVSLRRLATLVASEPEPRVVFDAIARESASTFDASAAVVVRFTPTRDAGTVVGAWFDDPAVTPAHGNAIELRPESAVGGVAADGTSVRIDGVRGDDDHPGLLLTGVRYSGELATPIWVDGVIWGAVTVARSDGRIFGEAADDRLGRLAEVASLAIVSSDARTQLTRLASTDHLTGLNNRRAFQERLAVELERAQRHGRHVSLVVIDVDHFKIVNDTHGHPAGDRVLIEMARRLFEVVRAGEVVARIGGEEFAWILPETDGAEAVVAAERLRAAIASEPFPGVGRLSVSVGICGLSDAGEGTDLLRLADAALYWAKSQGRNRVFRYTADAVGLLPADEQERLLERAKTLASVQALARAVDAKDPSTQRHSERVAHMARRLARVCGWSDDDARRLHEAALVHDVGKIAVSEEILLKPGQLTAIEYERIKEHAVIGATMLEDALAPDQLAWVRGHHERHDGQGYPDGLAGDEISAGARLLALADAWDAMTVARPYGVPRGDDEAFDECFRMAGTQFAPEAVMALEVLRASERGEMFLAGGSAMAGDAEGRT